MLGRPVRCRVLRGLPGLHPPDARSHLPIKLQQKPKYLQTLPGIWGANSRPAAVKRRTSVRLARAQAFPSFEKAGLWNEAQGHLSHPLGETCLRIKPAGKRQIDRPPGMCRSLPTPRTTDTSANAAVPFPRRLLSLRNQTHPGSLPFSASITTPKEHWGGGTLFMASHPSYSRSQEASIQLGRL